MIGIDTNVLVRLFAKDDEAQFLRSGSLIASLTIDEPGFIPLVTVAELVWVMRSRYGLSKPELVEMLEMLLYTPGLLVEKAERVNEALRAFSESSADFSDVLIERSASDAGCAYTVTFDEKAVRNAGMRPVP